MRQLGWCAIVLSALVAVGLRAQPNVDNLDATARQAYADRDYKRAAELSKQVYEMRRAVGPADDFALATAALNAGMALHRAGQSAEAVTYIETACHAAVARFGEVHPSVGSCLMELVEALAGAGQLPLAKQGAIMALGVIDATYPKDGHAAAVFHVGEIFRDAGDSATALHYFNKAAEIYSPSDLDETGFQIVAMTESGQLLYGLKRFAEAATLLERAMRLYDDTSQSLSAEAVSRIYMLADCYRRTGDFDQALALLNRVAAALTGMTAAGHVATDDILLQVAELQYDSGGSSEALATLQNILGHSEESPTADSRNRRLAAFNLAGRVHSGLHEYAAAEESFRTALAEARAAGGASTVSDTLDELGFFLLRRGRYAEARATFDEALSITEGIKGKDSVDVANLLERMAVGLANQGDCDSARPVLDRARRIYAKHVPQSVEMARVLSMAAICAGPGTARTALRKQALTLRSKLEGETSVDWLIDSAQLDQDEGKLASAKTIVEGVLARDAANAAARELLANLLNETGRHVEAAEMYRLAIATAAARYGEDSINVAARRFNVGRILLRGGDAQRARESFLAAAAGFGQHVQRLFSLISLAEQQQMLAQQTAVQVSGVLSSCQDEPSTTDGYQLIVPWKGMIVDGLRRQSELARSMEARAGDPVVKRLKTLRTQLALWSNSRDAHAFNEWKMKNDRLTAEKEALERTLLASGDSAELNVTLAALRSALRDAETLVDVYQYDQFGSGKSSPGTYAAVITSRNAPPRFVRLGTAAQVDAAVSLWVARVNEGAGEEEWKALSRRIWAPITNALPKDTRMVRVSPDGDLVRVPWHTFTKRDLEVVEVDSARSLLRARSAKPLSAAVDRILIVGGLDYDAGRTPRTPGQPGIPFPTLRFTKSESQAIQDLALANHIGPIWLKDAAATKSAVLKELGSGSYLHFATHGFVFGITGESGGATRTPLVDSGVALSGANVRDPRTFQSSGILTAEEIIDANMSSASLVVLSACNTALGVKAAGQGVLGLRSSLQAAGARKLVLSLWPVDDEATHLLMSNFYRRLWREKKTVLVSFHEAQEAVRLDARFQSPKYWLGWSIVDPD